MEFALARYHQTLFVGTNAYFNKTTTQEGWKRKKMQIIRVKC
jgi:hypothetical protein